MPVCGIRSRIEKKLVLLEVGVSDEGHGAGGDVFVHVTGCEFYGKTVPRIAKALELIEKSLDKPAPAAGFPFACEVSAGFLSELYQGNYDPSDEPDTDEISRCSAEILANETSLRAAVPPDIWEQIDHTFFLINKRGDGQREQAFAAG